jgi:cell division septum initiation protein DivIVA
MPFMSLTSYFFITIVAALVGFFGLLLYRMFKREQEFEGKQEKLLKDESKILRQARTKARDIVTRATDQSIRLFHQAGMTNEHIIETLDAIIQESLKKHLETFHITSDQMLSEYTRSLGSLEQTVLHTSEEQFHKVQQQSDEAFSTLNATLRQEVGQLPAAVEKRLQETLSAIEKEAEAYKALRLAKIDRSIQAIFLTTYKEILGESITLSVQEHIVVNALDKAKQEGVFTSWQTHQ